jgi:hypothetical protein
MKQLGCEHEVEVIRALHSGEWTEPLRLHAAACQDCSQALHLAETLKARAQRTEARFNPPDPHWIFERARRRAREIAVRRMGRVLTLMRTLAACYVIAAAAWLMRGYAAGQYHEVASALRPATAAFALLGVAVAGVFVAAGLWPILGERAGR